MTSNPLSEYAEFWHIASGINRSSFATLIRQHAIVKIQMTTPLFQIYLPFN